MRVTPFILGFLLLPLSVYAQTTQTFGDLVNVFLGIIQLLIPLVFALTFIMLSWGVIKAWIINDGNAEKVAEGRMLALWGVIGLVVMSGLWGILAFVRASFFGF